MIELFAGLKPGERTICLIRKHWSAYVINLVLAVSVSLGIVAALTILLLDSGTFSTSTAQSVTTITSAALLSSLFLMLYGFVDQYLDVLIITSERILVVNQNGLFQREAEEIHLHDLIGVRSTTNGVLAHYLRYGRLIIKNGEDNREIVVNDIPRVSDVSKLILELHTQYLESKETIGVDEAIINKIDCGFGSLTDEYGK